VNLTSPKVIKEILKQYHLYFNKRLGQNFLIDDNIVNKIVEAGDVHEGDIVLEIGPGIGTMTKALAEKAFQVIAIEIDTKFIAVLHQTLKAYDNVEIINADVLKLDLKEVFFKEDKVKRPIKVVSNLPYYITTPIIMRLLESDLPIERMTFLIQREVGERLSAVPGTKAYGSLSIVTQFYAQTEVAFFVPASVFMPKPKVDSIVVTFQKYIEPQIQITNQKTFFKIVKAAFLNRRKTLINSLNNNTDYSKETILIAMQNSDIDSGIRGETLTGKDFARLTNALERE